MINSSGHPDAPRPKLPWRLRLLLALGGGPSTVQADQRRLVLRSSRRNGCGGIFMLMWLCGWSFGLVAMGRQVLAAHDVRGLAPLALMGAIEIAVIGATLYALCAHEELRVENGCAQYALRVLIRFRRRSMPIDRVCNVQLVEIRSPPAAPKNAIRIVSSDSEEMIFGKDLLESTIARWARLLRERIEQINGLPLEPAPRLEALEQALRERHERMKTAALASVGAKSESDLENDPAAVKFMIDQSVKQATHRETPEPNIPDLPGPPGPLNNIFKSVVSWCAAVAWMLFAVMWIGATIGLIVRTIAHRTWTTIFVLVPLVGVSFFLALVLWAGISAAAQGIGKRIRRAFGRDRRS